MTLSRFKLLLPLTLLALAGCGSVGSSPSTATMTMDAPPTDPEVTARLAEAAQRTATAVESLASVEQARTPELYTPIVTDAPAELRLLVTVNWTGPWENILHTLAERVNYKFQAIGKAPATPIVVTVDAKQQPFVDVIRTIGLQGSGRADLVLDSKNKVIEVRYAPDTGR